MTIELTQEVRERAFADPANVTPELMAAFDAGADAAATVAPEYWRRIIPSEMIAAATADDLREIVTALVRHADIRRAREAALVSTVHNAVACGRAVEKTRDELFRHICIQKQTHDNIAQILDFGVREQTIRLAREGLTEMVSAGCPPVPWPDASEIEFPDGWKQNGQ